MTTVDIPMGLDIVAKATLISTHPMPKGMVRLELLFDDGHNYHSLWKGVVDKAQIKEIMSIHMFMASVAEEMEGLK